MSISPSTSYPDLRVHRIKRKPPPVLDSAEAKYPSPDPTDPFAPLWVLRNRTSSALLAPNRDSSDETLAKWPAQKHPIALPFNNSSATVVNAGVVSPVLTSPTRKPGHYRTRSQTLLMANSQAFPVVNSPEFSHKNMHFQDVDRSWSIYEQSDRTLLRSPLLADLTSDSSGTESDTSLDVQPTIHRSRNNSSHRLMKLLHPKKASPLAITSIPSNKPQHKHVSKASISPPIVSKATWESPVSPVLPHSAVDGWPENDINLTPPRVPVISNPISLDASCGSPRTRVSVGLAIHNELFDHDYSQHYSSHAGHKKDFSKGSLSHVENAVPFPAMSPEKTIRRKKVGPMPPPTPTSPSHNSSSSFPISKPVTRTSVEQPPPDDAFTSPRPAPQPPCADMFQRKKLKPSRSACSTPSPLHSTPGEWDLPDATQLTHVSSLPIISENGQRITFGSLFATHRTIVIFIRHFWCPLCQDYMSSLKASVTPDVLRSARSKGDGEKLVDTELVIVGNGSPVMMAKYRQIFGLSFKMYTDPTNAVYKALGMGTDKNAGHLHNNPSARTSGEISRMSEKFVQLEDRPRKRGGYVRHGMMSGIALVVMRAIKVGMPVWEKGGDIAQLGGEFVLGPGQTCSFAHRMQSPKGHAPIRDVLEAAGIILAAPIAPEHRKPSQDSVKPVRLTRKVLSSRSLARPSDSSMSSDEHNDNVISLNSPPLSCSTTMQSNSTQMGHENVAFPADTVSSSESRSFSVRVASMTPEEEDSWMERRQRSIERLRERKNIRRGLTSRTFVAAEISLHGPKQYIVDLEPEAVAVERGESGDCEQGANKLDATLEKSIQGSPLMPTAAITGTDDYTVIL